MNYLRQLRIGLALWAGLVLTSSGLFAAEGIISRTPDASGSYCHLRFPAIQEQTLGSGRPVLKDPAEGDIIDFYGPCDHDPLGAAEIHRQKADWRRLRDRIDGESD